MNRHELSLEPISLEVGAMERLRIAADVGFEYVSIVAHQPAPVLPLDDIATDAALRREFAEAMKARGIKVLNIECFNLVPEVDPADFQAGLACGHELGARTATAIVMENPDRADALAKYQRLCDMAAEMNIRVCLEFFAMAKSMASLDAAIAFVQDSGRPNAAVCVDIQHVISTGSSIEALKAMDPAMIGSVQISDGPLAIESEEAMLDVVTNRLVPGAGEFPLREFVAMLPREVVIGVEVPQARLIGTTPPEERARAMFEGTRNLYA